MSVAVAHQVRSSSELALTEGAREARFRATDLVVLHVVESLDNDIAEANRAGISDAVHHALTSAGLDDVRWDIRLVAGGGDPAGDALVRSVVEDEWRVDVLLCVHDGIEPCGHDTQPLDGVGFCCWPAGRHRVHAFRKLLRGNVQEEGPDGTDTPCGPRLPEKTCGPPGLSGARTVSSWCRHCPLRR